MNYFNAGRKRLKTNERIHQQHLDAHHSNIDKNTHQLMIHTITSVYYKEQHKILLFADFSHYDWNTFQTEAVNICDKYDCDYNEEVWGLWENDTDSHQLMCCWCIKTDFCISWLFGACCQTLSGFFSTWKSSHLSYMNHFLPAALNQTAALRFPGFTFWALSKNPVYMKLQQVWKLDSLFYSHCCTNLIWHVWVKTPSLNCKTQ